jgi:ABC-2 type transport system ATP-binding protein
MKVKNLTLKVHGKKILDNVSFDIKSKTALIGPNGSGKTMTLSVLAQLIMPSSGGFVDTKGKNVLLDESFKQKMGVMIQQGHFDPDEDVMEEMGLVKELKKDNIDLKELLKCYNIDNMPIKYLPHGKYHILMVLQALMGNPQLVILDEPFSGLDIVNRKIIEKMLKEYKGKLIITSHLLEEVKTICDNVVFIKDGKVIEEKKVSQIKDLEKYYLKLYSEPKKK